MAIDAFGNALATSLASQSSSANMPGPVSAEERAAILDLFKDGPGSGAPSTYSGGQAWAADVAARRAAAKAGQLDALRASIASSEVNIDTRPGSIYVQSSDSLSKIAARFPEYGSTNDLKNQLIAANPWLSDPNMLREGMELKFLGAGTAVNSAAMARAVGADARYQAALTAQQPETQEPVWSFREAGRERMAIDTERVAAEASVRIDSSAQATAWDGVTRQSPAEAYLGQARGGLDAVRGDHWQFRVAQSLPDAALNEIGGLAVAKVFGRMLGWADSIASRVTSLDPFDALQIVNTPKGLRPLPESYMPESMIRSHAALFESGVARIQPNVPTGTIGRTETWVMPKTFADSAIAEAGGDVRKLERLLGLDSGYLGSSPVRVDIPKPVGLRMSSGNEYGANTLWNPGGYTNGGIPEAVINPVTPQAYRVTPIKVR